MFKSLILSASAIFLLTACTSNNSNIHKNLADFETNKNFTNDSCAMYSYTSNTNTKEYGKLFKEYIDLDMSCKWNGFERGYFTDLFKNELKLKSMKNVETLDFQNYEITTYEINNDSYVNFVYYFSADQSQFIIDYDGKLADKLAKKFNPKYQNKYLDKKRFNGEFNASLVEKNIIKHYFGRTYEASDDKSN